MEDVISILLHGKIELTGAGRTDAGVHASVFYAHFDLIEPLKPGEAEKLVFKINSFLGKDIAVDNIFPVSARDHARFSAISRTYQYHIY